MAKERQLVACGKTFEVPSSIREQRTLSQKPCYCPENLLLRRELPHGLAEKCITGARSAYLRARSWGMGTGKFHGASQITVNWYWVYPW